MLCYQFVDKKITTSANGSKGRLYVNKSTALIRTVHFFKILFLEAFSSLQMLGVVTADIIEQNKNK